MADAVIGKIAQDIEKAEKAGKYFVSAYYSQLAESEQQLVGYVMGLGYSEATVIANDYYKHRCGGIPKNSFLLIRPEPYEPAGEMETPQHLILVRVLESASTPLSNDVSRTYFEMHKSHMPEIDVFTKAELQWGAIKAGILGTFYDDPETGQISFGADIETYYSPHLYAVYTPTPHMLETLINAFVDPQNSVPIGFLRLTESNYSKRPVVSVKVAPKDFVGARTALFGKTRMGKSNTVKIIVQMIMQSQAPVGQVIFDLNGEYAYRNEQDETSIYDLFEDRCLRYTLRGNPEPGVGVLKANFYENLTLGHEIIRALYEDEHGKPADYERAFLEWEIPDENTLKKLKTSDPGDWTRASRNISIYRCVLLQAGFLPPADLSVKLFLRKEVRQAISDDSESPIPEALSLQEARRAYAKAWQIYDEASSIFKSDDPYFDAVAKSLLTILSQKKGQGGGTVSGHSKLRPFSRYHSPDAGNLAQEILAALDTGQAVIFDLSNAPETVSRFYSELISREVFRHQMDKFTSNSLGDHYVQFFFEEAHNLFPKDDKDLRSIYNRLAKEGAKLNIGLVYSTQSIASLSPDLLKNTENFFIAHLNDASDIKALTRFYEFEDVGADVQRTKTRGFVRMITSSHKFAIPVQINKFGPAEEALGEQEGI